MKNYSSEQVVKHMLSKDNFSAWLNIQLLELAAGNCRISMEVREEMLNGFGIAHGGITFSLADTALAIACNSHNRLSVALDASISFPVSVKVGDILTATATEVSLANKTGVYQILVSNQDHQTVAIFKGTVYRTSKALLS